MQTDIDTDRINGLVNRLVELTEQGVDFSLEQLPEIAREIVLWGIVTGIAGVVGIAAIIAAVIGLHILIEHLWSKRGVEVDRAFVVIFGGAFGLAGLVACVLAIFNGVKALVAPRLYIIEYLQGML